MAQKRIKRPRDPIQLAKVIGDIATGQAKDVAPTESARAHAGRLGGVKGGMARAQTLTAERRSQIAKKAATTRWKKKRVVTVD